MATLKPIYDFLIIRTWANMDIIGLTDAQAVDNFQYMFIKSKDDLETGPLILDKFCQNQTTVFNVYN